MKTDQVNIASQVKEANDIVGVISSYISLSPAGSAFKGICPFHHDTRPSLHVNPKWQNFRCWACGKHGDVFTFTQEMEKINFREALELLAKRAGISLSVPSGADNYRQRLIEVTEWAAQQYRMMLLENPLAETARLYLGERKLHGNIVRSFGLGYAPLTGDWLVDEIRKKEISTTDAIQVGLIGERREEGGFYDRFRDRVLFPIRNLRGQSVGFGGRILPSSPFAARGPKYYNSPETPIFNKSELLYALDVARLPAAQEGNIVVVEGYMDVLMAHQHGIANVVATMGTALNIQHIALLRRTVPKVILVFDADAGGQSGVDRALELFISADVDLSIVSLPVGLDPCDWLIQEGSGPFRKALQKPIDALDFKINQLLNQDTSGVQGTQRTLDAILQIMTLVPEQSGQTVRVKQELIITRLAHRLGLRQETVWARLGELKNKKRKTVPARNQNFGATNHSSDGNSSSVNRTNSVGKVESPHRFSSGDKISQNSDIVSANQSNHSSSDNSSNEYPQTQNGNFHGRDGGEQIRVNEFGNSAKIKSDIRSESTIKIPGLEKQLLELLLADGKLVSKAMAAITPADISHPDMRRLLECLYQIHQEGEFPNLDSLRMILDDPYLIARSLQLEEVGRLATDRERWLDQMIEEFRNKKTVADKKRIESQLTAVSDHQKAMELLKKLQMTTNGTKP